MIATRIRAMSAPHWLAFFALVLVGWALLFVMAVPAELRALEGVYGAAFIEALCTITLSGTGYLAATAMWALMSAAMMAPTALRAFATYDDLSHATPAPFWHLLAGYLVVWLGFSALAAGLQLWLFHLQLIGAFGQSLSAPLTAALLFGAGLYQFSPIKEACLAKCRAPLAFFMQHWSEGPFRNGLRLGAVCLGCCWALMLLGFVGGVMNLAFMGLAMVLMTLEKLPAFGRYLTKPLGVALIASSPLSLILTL